MIVDPDFLDHWKTQMLIDTLDDPCAPLYVIRLWAHCQTRRGWVFDIPIAGVKSICKFAGDAEALNQALIECEFLAREDRQVTVVGWDEHNSTLIANWANGKKGGRPPKNKPKQNPSKTHGLPMANPDQTHQEPIRLDRIGLDKKGEDQKTSTELATPDAVYYIPTNKYGTQGESYPVTEDDLVNWAELYPAVNLQAEIRKIIGWSQSNTGKRKTLKGMPKFINSWLSRAQDKGGGSPFVTKAEEAEYYGQKYNEDQLL